MSSILDALRKLEQEKAGREQAAAKTPVRELALDHELDLTPRRDNRRSSTGTIALVVGGLLVVAGITAGVSTFVVMMSRNAASPVQVASLPDAPVASTPVPIHQPTAPAVQPQPAPEKPKPAEPIVQVARATAPDAPASKPKPESKPEPKLEVKPVPPAPVAVVPPPAPQPATAPAPASAMDVEPRVSSLEKVELEKLPLLTESERVRLGLPPIKINIVGVPNNRNPRASALINMQKVYVGENIPNTEARLIDVDLHGVGLEIRGKRYYFSKH